MSGKVIAAPVTGVKLSPEWSKVMYSVIILSHFKTM